MYKQLIINADDFGWDADAVEGILNLSVSGNVSSTTIMATHAEERDILELKKIRRVSKGLHLNLIDGRPVSPGKDVKSLTDAEGNFFPASELTKRFLMNRISLAELEIEIKNQIAKLTKIGIDISHVDSHQHVHQFPVLGNFILPILKRSGIKKIRNVNINNWKDKRRIIIQLMSLFPNSSIKNFTCPDLLLCDFSVEKEINEGIFGNAVSKAFKRNQIVELMTHPALNDRSSSYLRRKYEYEFLSSESWKEILDEHQIRLVSYDMI